MRNSLLKIKTEYNKKSNAKLSKFSPFYNYLKVEAPSQFMISANLKPESYSIKFSAGIGKKAHIPWIGIYKNDPSIYPKKGFCVVYLFNKDLSGVYISLNQGVDSLITAFKNRRPQKKINLLTGLIRETLKNDENVSLDNFDLFDITLQSTSNSRYYEPAHICGKYYSLDALPEENVLVDDLHALLKIYELVCEKITSSELESMIYDLISEEPQDLAFQIDVQNAESACTSEKAQMRKQPILSTSKRLIWPRDSSIAKEAILKANYLCEIDAEHLSFLSKSNDVNFVEAHHLIPMSKQSLYNYSIDVPGNIVALCPNCHRQIHHAKNDIVKAMIKKLYTKRNEQLKNYGIQTNFIDLFEYYK